MVGELVYQYYIEQNLSCVQTVMRVANEQWNLKLRENSYTLMRGHDKMPGDPGDRECGALYSAVAAISVLLAGSANSCLEDELAHILIEAFKNKYGLTKCFSIKMKHAPGDRRCFSVLVHIMETLAELMEIIEVTDKTSAVLR